MVSRKMSTTRVLILSWLIFSLCAVSNAYAGPIITGASGTFSQGGSVTITGSGFGTKTTPAPLKWDDFENGTAGNDLGNGWVLSGGGNPMPYYSKTRSHSGSISILCDFTTDPEQYGASFGLDMPIPSLYVSAWRYVTTSGAPSRNLKTVRLYGNSNDYPAVGHTHFPITSSMLIYAIRENPDLRVSTWYDGPFDLNTGTWERVEYYWKMSDPGVPNGESYYWLDGKLKGTILNEIFRDSDKYYWNQLRIGGYFARDVGTPTPSAYFWWDDVYVDSTRARVELGNASAWSACTHREIQIPSAWSDSSISITVNEGTLTGQAYLYVVDANGVANAQGHLVSIGGSSEDNVAPNPPPNARIE